MDLLFWQGAFPSCFTSSPKSDRVLRGKAWDFILLHVPVPTILVLVLGLVGFFRA